MTTRIGVVGSREYPNEAAVRGTVASLPLIYGPDFVVVSGGAPGVDTWAEEEADAWGYEKDILRAKWTFYGKAAGMIRNKLLVESCDMVYIFWDGESPGTRNVIGHCVRTKTEHTIYGKDL